jgi:hypothetical protein
MKTYFAALALGATLFTTAALADGMAAQSSNTMAPAATTNTMAPAGGGMMGTTHHKPKPKKTTPPANGMMAPAPSNTMAPASGGMGGH